MEHPVLKNLRLACDYDAPFLDEDKQVAITSYYGLCSFVDDMVGKVIAKLCETGLDQNTVVIFRVIMVNALVIEAFGQRW